MFRLRDADGDKAELLFRLVDSTEHGVKRLREAVACGTDAPFISKTSIRLFNLLGSEQLQKPMFKTHVDQLLEALYRVPFYISALAASADKASAPRICWFLISIALNLDDARKDKALLKCISEPGIAACKESAKLKTILMVAQDSSAGVARPAGGLEGLRHPRSGLSIADVSKLPGHRHDNDHMDYRQIQIVPTVAEAASKEEAFTPLADAANKFLSDDHAHALDTHFRLLREDFVRPLKQELAKADRPKLFRNAYFESAEVKPLSCVMVKFDAPAKLAKASKEKRWKYWEEDRLLQRGSLVCLLQHGTPKLFGRIVDRDSETLANYSRIGLEFEGKGLITALTYVNIRDAAFEIVPVSSSFFSYEPILRRLQQLSSFPFAEELVDLEKPAAVTYLDEPKARDQLDILRRKMGIEFDPSQKMALDAALRDRVSLLQGPPGTGKTFIGTLVAQAILNASNATILCVCYTNHALDQFLEALLDAGVDDIVRLGGRTKNERIEKFQLRNLSEHQDQTKEQKKQWWLISSELTELEDEFTKCVGFLGMDRLHWRRLSGYLETDEPDVRAQLYVAPTAHGWEIAGGDGKKVGPDYLWQCWRKGNACPPAFVSNSGPLWSASMGERKRLMASWLNTIKRGVAQDCSKIMLRHQQLAAMKQSIRHDGDRQILEHARVIGCTTHGAATRKELLVAAGAKVLIVEEAAEILEAHVITSIGESVEHVIMIGDHQQLRPKAECYDLTVEAEKGCNLNTSMFERLVKNGFPFQALAVQHRMRPQISKLIRDFPTGGYPQLQDAPKVHEFPDLLGVQKNVVFIHHENHEEEVESMFDDKSFTRVNMHEVKMVVAIVDYLLKQGYKLKQLVVLTPYGSQLKAIKQALAELDLSVLVDDKDLEDLQQAGAADEDDVADEHLKDAIRVATIDNYQGEEADVVVASLVRSNPERKIGHLQEPERVNVLLSRARHGMILLGNAKTLMNARVRPGAPKDLWKNILKTLQTDGSLLAGLPLVCQNHPQQASTANTPGAFAKCAPDGGCTRPCDVALSCGHKCRLRCHSYDPDHTRKMVLCEQPVNDRCEKGHVIARPCYYSGLDSKARAAMEVECKACEAEAAERQRLKKIADAAVVKRCEDDLRRVCQEQRDNPRLVHYEELQSTGPDAAEYLYVKDRTEKYTTGQHGINMTVSKIERVVSSKLHAMWLEARMGLVDPSKDAMVLFHGTSVDGVKGICEDGFRLPDWSEDNMFGQGAYFATDSSKSAQELYTKGSNRIMLCDVLLGKSCEVSGLLDKYPLRKHQKKSRKARPYLDVNLEKVRAAGFDSVFAKRGGSMQTGGVANDEFIVYDPRQARPRYVVHFGGAGSAGAVAAARPGRSLGGGVTKRELKPQGAAVVKNEEAIHYNAAVVQFSQMLGGQGHKVTAVDWYDNPSLAQRFESCKLRLKSSEEVWVFHGCSDAAIVPKIMTDGFKVAGVDPGVPIKNGAAYGNGVYSATGPGTPMNYAQGAKCVILARAVKGKHGPGPDTGCDSWCPHSDWLIFKAKEQLLPVYVVHY